ncbi:MAG: sigma-70 family RNA polymerase sigma factor [Acutalibacteraceae bacterium]|nr:sigma-70 family RNA polymerase sigma factor [Acutalibacteraceae bacterium]
MKEIQGTKERAEEIIKQHADMVYRIAVQNVKNPNDAQDIFQEVCMALLTKNAPLFDELHIKNWLIRVTINKCNNFNKSVWQSRTESIDEHSNLIAPETDMVLDELYKLPKNYRNVIYLYYYEEYTIPEIADILGKSKNTISAQLQRARKKLKKILDEGE